MSFHDFMAARMLLAEEAVGRRARDAGRAEDAAMRQGLKHIRSME